MVASIILFLLVTSTFSIAAAQQRNSNIDLGSSLTPTNNSYWSSNSGHFAFGFYKKGDGFAVGIWLANIQQRTVVWTANRDGPPLSSDFTLNLSSDGELILQQKQGQRISIVNLPQPASSASMLNSGNFVLYNSEYKIIWRSFDVPTDTLLPGQRLLTRNELVSSISETDHSSGKFRIRMRANGNLVQYPVDSRLEEKYAYWESNTEGAGDNVTLNLDSNGQLYLLNSAGFNIKTLQGWGNTSGKAIYRATIDADGIFRLYSHSLDYYGNWSIEWSSTADKCAPLGLCGLNGYCTLVNQNPTCACPPGFDFVDQGQKNLGCERNSSLEDCTERTCTIHELNNLSWEDKPYSVLSTITKVACKEECLKDNKCQVALYRNTWCRKQELPLRFGRFQQSNPATTIVKVRIGGLGTRSMGRKEIKGKLQMNILITGIVFLTLAFFLLASFGILIYRYRVWEYKKILSHWNDELLDDVTLRSFAYQELKRATNNFTDEIGKGGFGTVFRGVMSNGNRVVAIKRLEKVMADGEREFLNEVKAIGRTHHKNLVRLLGYCHNGTNRLLVYEYMSNGSLADFLFRSQNRPAWEQRIEIALSIARGILYLHEECDTQIIHCDIKPENILMDEKERAKIADFGLSKLLMSNQSKTDTGVRGTRGYLAPEWYRNLPITVKADVFSFGIMLLEIICCRRSVDMDVPENEEILVDWVQDCFEARELDKLIQDEGVENSNVERIVKVGLWCIQDEPSMRPSIKKVVLMLEGTIDIPDPPSPPSFVSSIKCTEPSM